MSAPLDPALWDAIHAEKAGAGGSTRAIAARLVAAGWKTSQSGVFKYLKIPRPAEPPPATAPIPAEGFKENVADGTAELVVRTDRIVRTYEDAVRAAEVDLTMWRVKSWEATAWTVAMRVRRGQDPATKLFRPDQSIQTQQHGVRLSLERILPRHLNDATDAVFARLAKHAPKYPPPPKARGGSGEPFLGVVGLFDAHFGKLCWGAETGAAYDLRIAERVYANAVEDMLAETAARPVAQWVLPIGNDFYHIDNSRNTTYAGTPQDVDGRYAKVIEAGEMAVVTAIEQLAATAPVRVVWVPGNHDPTTSYHLARTVAAWFRRCDRVAVDYSPSPRKYVAWHRVLLGLTHGNEEKKESLPSLMATEQPDAWAAAKACREWLVGHDHRARQWVTKATDTYEGTVVRVLRAITGTDSWHHRKGFVGTTPAGEIYWYGRDRGYAGHAVVNARGA